MKIGVISDLHVDRYHNDEINESTFLREVSNEVRRLSLDLLIIAGDISNDHIKSQQFTQAIEGVTGVKVIFIPGNHDFWNASGDDKSSWEIYDYFKHQPNSLLEKPYIINDEWAIVGSPAWYDYSFASERFSYEELERRAFKGGHWQDKFNIDFKISDVDVANYFAELTKKDLEKVKDKKIILVTHVATNKKFRVPMPHKIFDYYNAFMGTTKYDDFYNEYDIRYSVSGHIHFRHNFIENGVTFICACLGYRREWRTKVITKEIRDAMYVIQI
ncbi:metallophosphoesterase [Nosocomiicoccus massiliensis]|uniref:Metallophosphoesterase n=1 Tax=Nosocomiicoccus massiliensis TaxID=1232430 RepID=A0AAF0YKL5_9STAP|nr:metallophosphoesterase [Nosocomiicoccus massiliensis]WOS95459.1 metallophosphoesterase [Nosocomiicoccus massiliensis]